MWSRKCRIQRWPRRLSNPQRPQCWLLNPQVTRWVLVNEGRWSCLPAESSQCEMISCLLFDALHGQGQQRFPLKKPEVGVRKSREKLLGVKSLQSLSFCPSDLGTTYVRVCCDAFPAALTPSCSLQNWLLSFYFDSVAQAPRRSAAGKAVQGIR